MRDFEKAPKKPTNLSLNAEVLELARSMDVNISQTVDKFRAQAVRRLHWEKWNERNQETIAAQADRPDAKLNSNEARKRADRL